MTQIYCYLLLLLTDNLEIVVEEPLMGSLELINLEKNYGETRAVRGVNLSLASSQYCCLLGPSGCGKTSLLRMIAGHEVITLSLIHI